eukprot:TRINITY_DN40018_c0_g1_i1.p1 TRINITY_DN40018_c0_g1~~TRINITY_DN40018_c0_g1_i1.p1  ORF type:complete len:496 (-),score=47.41 TRINITY_DN40018_c0_g1_i1:73-1560(-)
MLPISSELARMDRPLNEAPTAQRVLRRGGSAFRRSNSNFHNVVTMGRPGAPGGDAEVQQQKRLRRPEAREKSFVFRMLSSHSRSFWARLYRTSMLALILANVAAFLVSSNDFYRSKFAHVFDVVEAVTSVLFLIDYVLRVATITEQQRYSAKGPIWGRLSWMLSLTGLLDALSTFPYFLDHSLFDNVLPSFTWVRFFRVFLLFRTSKYAHAMNTVFRVLWVNSEILGVSLFLVVFMLLFTSGLLWMTASHDERKANGIDDVPSAMYLAVLMLTGQGTPDGDLEITSKCVVVLTAFLSVPFFAVPAAMLTWGFEGEAERLAQQQRKRYARNRLYGSEFASALSSSSSEDEGTTLEDYLDLVGGAEDDEANELESRALAFFENASNGPSLLPAARELASELEATRLRSRNRKQLQADALTLLGQVGSGPDENRLDWEGEMERRLQLFRARVATEGTSFESRCTNRGVDPSPDKSSVDYELRALRMEIASLRRELSSR